MKETKTASGTPEVAQWGDGYGWGLEARIRLG